MKVLVTGAAGFIGMHVCERLLARGDEVVGVDCLNDYYDVSLKEARLARLKPHGNFRFHKLDIADRVGVAALFVAEKPQRVINLAAQAGVRYSLENPHAYVDSNLVGFVNILEGCRHQGVDHLLFASSSSVYGGNTKIPFSESDNVDHPVSLYAATKKANELMAHSYAHLYGLPVTGLRFFTVYGPWGRPDMAYYSFTKAILAGQSIDVFNHGKMLRDFTFIDDAVEAVMRLVETPPDKHPEFDTGAPDPASSWAPFRVLNLGNHQPIPLMNFVSVLVQALGKKADINMLPMQDGDVVATHADTAALSQLVKFSPTTPLVEGIREFVSWYRRYHGAST
ncbi:MAG: NAD-dependent epimerase [Deltaproteobacteria bacterium]|nr:NAD-dependent epimerase [Deltaproteobacteria bacterium]